MYNPTEQEREAAVLSFAIVPTIPKVSPSETERSVAFYPLALSLWFLFYLLEARRHLALRPLYERNSPRVETERMHSASKRRLVYKSEHNGKSGHDKSGSLGCQAKQCGSCGVDTEEHRAFVNRGKNTYAKIDLQSRIRHAVPFPPPRIWLTQHPLWSQTEVDSSYGLWLPTLRKVFHFSESSPNHIKRWWK